MWQQLLAGALLVLGLFWLLRLALGLRTGRLEREAAKREHERQGRRVVAELPRDDGSVDLFLEDAAGFYWGGGEVARDALLGARLLLNDGVVATCSRAGCELPPPGSAEEYEGRERWEVRLYLRDGGMRAVACGRLREGVSRGAGRAVIAAVEAGLGGGA